MSGEDVDDGGDQAENDKGEWQAAIVAADKDDEGERLGDHHQSQYRHFQWFESRAHGRPSPPSLQSEQAEQGDHRGD